MREIKSTNPAKELRRNKLEKLKECFLELNSYKNKKLRLKYPVFFIPGWTGENCAAWKEPYPNIPKKYKQYYRPARHWINEIIENKEDAYYIVFSDKESESSPSFMELGVYLKRKLTDTAQENPISLVGHSMGGLDIRSAILDNNKPVLNVKKAITVGTPNNGVFTAGVFGLKLVQRVIEKYKKLKPHHLKQGYNLYSSSPVIKEINTPENRLKLLNRVEKFYIFMGLRDSTVMRSPKLRKEDIPEGVYKEKVDTNETSSAEHSDKDGITQDPRVFLPIIKVLCGIELKDDYNHGYIYKKT